MGYKKRVTKKWSSSFFCVRKIAGEQVVCFAKKWVISLEISEITLVCIVFFPIFVVQKTNKEQNRIRWQI